MFTQQELPTLAHNHFTIEVVLANTYIYMCVCVYTHIYLDKVVHTCNPRQE